MSLRRFTPVIAIFAGACATARGMPAAAPDARTMSAIIDSIADAEPMQRTLWGIQVLDQQTGRILYERNGNRHFIPASNTKLVVTTVAMGALGPDFRYRTPVYARTTTEPGVASAVLIAGSGDPSFSARHWGRRFAAAAAFADSIYAAGIRRIDGPLMIDASRFTDSPINGTWEVADLPGVYAPPVGAFAIDEANFRVVFEPGAAPGDPVTAHFPDWPAGTGGQSLDLANVRTVAAGTRGSVQTDFLGRRDVMHFSGTVPIGRPDTATYSMTDATLYAGRAVAAALESRGVRLRGAVMVLRDSASAAAARASLPETPIAVFVSPPMSQLVSDVLHPSQNWIAEMLLKTLGAEKGSGGSWREGIAVERNYLVQNVGLDSLDFNLRDASGMAPQDLLSPHAIVRMLEHTRTAPWGSLYRAALAAPGEPGTLNTRLTEYTGRLQGKTGTISNVATLSGFLTTDGGRQVTFAVMTNGTGLSSGIVRRYADDIVRTIARMTPR
jgi:serine-type D-Ala-D-Ala carboxypeptidase/endopeptidase (penicillin-binding protein 4)